MNRRQKLLNWLLTLTVFAWTIWQAATTFQTSYLRIGEAFRDLGLSVKFFFCLLLGLPNYTMPTVNSFSDVMPWRLIPEEWAAFWASVWDYFRLLLQGSNLKAYGDAVMGDVEKAKEYAEKAYEFGYDVNDEYWKELKEAAKKA